MRARNRYPFDNRGIDIESLEGARRRSRNEPHHRSSRLRMAPCEPLIASGMIDDSRATCLLDRLATRPDGDEETSADRGSVRSLTLNRKVMYLYLPRLVKPR